MRKLNEAFFKAQHTESEQKISKNTSGYFMGEDFSEL